MKASADGLTRPSVPIVVVLFHREHETKKMFEQLEKVTSGYSLILVDNGFDDCDFLERLNAEQYVKNHENTGAIQGINQGIELAEGKYIAVLHNDILIYDGGWLDEIVSFMERRPDVGLVGLQGAHTIADNGRFEYETNVVYHRGSCPNSLRPTWRFAQVAMIDGVGWVMRNVGIKLDERYGMMHCYDLDLALQYIQLGYSVYIRATDFLHQIQNVGGEVELERSSRGRGDYLSKIGGDDEGYFENATRQFKEKWRSLLPITRGFRDEAYGRLRVGEVRETSVIVERNMAELREYIGKLEEDMRQMDQQTPEAEDHIASITDKVRRQEAEAKRLAARIGQLEAKMRQK